MQRGVAAPLHRHLVPSQGVHLGPARASFLLVLEVASCTWSLELCKDLSLPGAVKHRLLPASLPPVAAYPGPWATCSCPSLHTWAEPQVYQPVFTYITEPHDHATAACFLSDQIGGAEDRPPNELKSPNLCYDHSPPAPCNYDFAFWSHLGMKGRF